MNHSFLYYLEVSVSENVLLLTMVVDVEQSMVNHAQRMNVVAPTFGLLMTLNANDLC